MLRVYIGHVDVRTVYIVALHTDTRDPAVGENTRAQRPIVPFSALPFAKPRSLLPWQSVAGPSPRPWPATPPRPATPPPNPLIVAPSTHAIPQLGLATQLLSVTARL